MSVFFKKYRNISFLFFFILILILITLLFLFFFQNTNHSLDEGFQQNPDSNSNSNSDSNIKNILFLGDSILNNQLYVSSGDTVEDLLQKQITSNKIKIFNYAQDGATISSVYQQLHQVPEYLNSADSILFLSIGGNDILSNLLKEENRNNRNNGNNGNNGNDRNNGNNRNEQDIYLSLLFEKYQILLETIHEKMNLSQIYILDIYYPIHPYFQPWISFLKKWNHLLENNKLSIPVITISNDLKESNDFIEFIEPSKSGGEKIAEILYNYSCIA